jgi:PAS domain S-box-containing protein
MFRQLKQLFTYYTELGIQKHFRPGRVKSIKLINQLSLFSCLIAFIFIFQFQEIKPFYIKVIERLAPIILILIPFLNRVGYFAFARYVFYLQLNICCLLGAALLGMESGVHLFFIPVIAGTALVFNLRKIKSFIPILGIPLLSIFLLIWLNDKMAIDMQNYTEELRHIYMQNFIITVLASFMLAYFYYRITHQQQVQLHEAIQKHTDLNNHLRRNEKKLHKNLQYSDKLMEHLRARNDYFKALLQNASDITAVVDREGYFKYITPSFFRLTGFKPNEIAKKTIFDFVHTEDLSKTLERFQVKLVNEESTGLIKFRYRKADGTYMYLEAKGTNLLEEKNVQGIVINSRDITDRLHYEEQARIKEENIRAILDNNDNRIWLLDRNYRLLDFNIAFAKSFKEYFGNHLQQHINIFDLVPAEEHEEWLKRYKAAENGSVHSYTDRFSLKEGERAFRITIFPIMDEGELDRLVVFAKDITEQEQVEQALTEAKEKAEEATQAKAQFLSTMSHEIRTPMNAVIGMTHLLLQDKPTPAQAENLRILKFSAENLLVLINDILDFSKIEAGKVTFEQTSFNLSQLVSDLKKSLLPAAHEKNISMEVLQDTDLPEKVMGDSVRLSQILINLLSNAIKFTEQGGVKVQLTVLQDALDGSLIQFKVSDTGIGVPVHMQEAIFESFTQGSPDTTRRFGGTGLGLAITKRLLELQGSRIELESKEGEGSVFSFNLRFEKPDAAESKMHENTSNKRLQEFSLRGKRILMVEDNPLNIFIGKKYLEKWEVEVQTAENGLQALEVLRQQSFDLILMDLQMPEMDGYETTRQIRRLENPQIARLPILAISAAAEPQVKQKALEAGINGFVVKPFKPDELLEQLSHYLALQLKA